MLKLLLAVLVGLVGAALLHLIIILALPHFTGRDAFTRVVMEGDPDRFHPLDASPDAAGLANADPYIRTAVCPISMDQQPARLMASGDAPFWSLAIFDSASNEIFSMNDHTAVDGVLDVVVASPVQLAAIRKASPPELEQTILVETTQSEGYAILRAMAPRPSFLQAASDFLGGASCAPLDWQP
jgi:uncharacterized membrane protein